MDKLGDGLKNLLLIGIGAAAATAEKADSMVNELVEKGELTVKQGKMLNEELKHKVKESRETAADAEAAKKDPAGFVKGLTDEEKAELLKALQDS
ncbi:MAG: hypothetical protein U0L49_10945 [Eubacterium sp.]|nr:hypothetical protein [Eubacterium sp.]